MRGKEFKLVYVSNIAFSFRSARKESTSDSSKLHQKRVQYPKASVRRKDLDIVKMCLGIHRTTTKLCKNMMLLCNAPLEAAFDMKIVKVSKCHKKCDTSENL